MSASASSVVSLFASFLYTSKRFQECFSCIIVLYSLSIEFPDVASSIQKVKKLSPQRFEWFDLEWQIAQIGIRTFDWANCWPALKPVIRPAASLAEFCPGKTQSLSKLTVQMWVMQDDARICTLNQLWHRGKLHNALFLRDRLPTRAKTSSLESLGLRTLSIGQTQLMSPLLRWTTSPMECQKADTSSCSKGQSDIPHNQQQNLPLKLWRRT